MLVWGDRHDTALDFLQEDSGQQFPLQKTVLITVIVFSVSFLTSYFYLLLRQGVCLLRLSLRRVFLDLATMASSKFPPTGSLGHRPAFQSARAGGHHDHCPTRALCHEITTAASRLEPPATPTTSRLHCY